MSANPENLARAQFGPRAAAYVASAVHAGGEDLDTVEAIARSAAGERALDLGCGGGHVAYRLARHFREVTACDLAPEMLGAVAETARARGIGNLVTAEGAAEALPFEDARFDLVATRFSAHHWADLDAGLREARRVLRAGGTAVLIDAVSPGRPLLDTHLQTVEVLRDPSHVRDYSVAEWVAATERAGFSLIGARGHRIRIEFASWIERMGTPPASAAAVRAVQVAAPQPVQAHFGIEPDGSFQLDVMLLEARA